MELRLRNVIDFNEPAKRFRFLLKSAVWLAVVMFVLGWVWQSFGVVFNLTKSMPKGLYAYGPVKSIKRGQTVLVRMRSNSQAMQLNDKRGYALAGARWVKAVVGMPGDCVNTQGLATSVCHRGHCLTFTCRTHDRYGRALSCHRFNHLIIPKNHYFLAGTNSPKSFDSRYFGLAHRDEIVNTAWRI